MIKKTRLDLECRCLICGLWWSIIDLDSLIKEVDSGYYISGIKCPSCEFSHHIDFDIIRVKSNCTTKESEEYLQKLREDYKKDNHFPYPKTNS